MKRTITAMQPQYLEESLDMIERTFTLSENADEGRMVRTLMTEMRRSPWYVPELELIMLQDSRVIGHVNFTRFPLEGRHSDKLLLLSPVATMTEYQRQGVSRKLIERGFELARGMGFTAVLVEGDPRNYRARGFQTSAGFGITAAERVRLPHPDCLMVRELIPGGLDGVTGAVDYDIYPCLSE